MILAILLITVILTLSVLFIEQIFKFFFYIGYAFCAVIGLFFIPVILVERFFNKKG